MKQLTIEKEYQRRINKVIDFIFKNISANLQLENLARVANYSPFHFQRIFKQVTSESPKQFIIRVRLEMAFHFLVIHPHKSIFEIGMSCGFSSPSIFSRAFKNYFRNSPDSVRTLTAREKKQAMRKLKLNPAALAKVKSGARRGNEVSTVHQPQKLSGIYVMAPMDNPTKIRRAFQDLLKVAHSNDLDCTVSKIFGVLSPRHGHTYMAFLNVDRTEGLLPHLNFVSILPGKYARIKVKGATEETMRSIHELFSSWLPDNGYKVAEEVILYESFSSNPALSEYSKLKRELHVPIQRE